MADENEIIDAETLKKLASQMNYDHSCVEINSADQDTDAKAFEGTVRVYQSSFGASISVSDVTPLSDQKHGGIIPRSFNILYLRCGNMQASPGFSFEAPQLDPGKVASISISKDLEMSTIMQAGHRTQVVNIHAQPEHILDEDLADQVFNATSSDQADVAVLSARLQTLAGDIFGGQFKGHMGQLLAESFAFELFVRALQGRVQSQSSGTKLDMEDTKKMHVVRDLVSSDPGAPHTLASLATAAGVSVSSLKSKFPLLTGKPVFQFLRDTRLEVAHAKIQQDGWSVSAAAEYVGYAHPENFSKAFRRRFGVSPSAVG